MGGIEFADLAIDHEPLRVLRLGKRRLRKTHITMQESRINTIFNSLEHAGYPRSLQRTLLPEWVTADVLADDSAAPEIATILAKRLGLRAGLLFGTKPTVETLRRRDTKYKRSIPNSSKNLTAATSIAVAVAETVAAACRVDFKTLASDALGLRKEVLKTVGGNWLGLRNLLMTCWAHGVPVIYLAELGDDIPKMDGMVVHTNSRPVIILSKASQLWAWQLFVLAHEVGHVALEHVSPDEILVDEELGADSYALEDSDVDERAADIFAIELLNGRRDATYTASESRVNGRELAEAAFQYGKANQIDPGHIALNFAHSSGNWGVGVAAAKILQGDNLPAASIINQAMWGGINADLLPPDTVEFLERTTDSVSE